MINFSADKAQKVLIAYKRKGIGIDDSMLVFINPFGTILLQLSQYHYKEIGRVVNESEFRIDGLTYKF